MGGLSEMVAQDLGALIQFGPQRGVEVLAAAVCGGVIGYERGARGSPVGMKTCALVCIGATMYMHVGQTLLSAPGVAGDPSRMASQIVTGIGFLGAGAILRVPNGVSGLTSAATIWFIGAVGVVIGGGHPLSGMALTAGVSGLLLLVAALERRLFPSRTHPAPIDPKSPGQAS